MKKQQKTKILFDAGPIVNGQKSGVGYYTAGLVSALASTHPNDIELVGHYFNFLGKKHDLDLPTAPNIRYRRTILFPGKVPYILRRLGLPLPFELFTKERGDFHLFTGFLGWPSIFKTPSAPAIHDLSYLEHPEYVSGRNQRDLERFVPATISRSSFLITISEVTKQKIIEKYVVHPTRIIVGHIPPTDTRLADSKKSQQLVRGLGIKKKYLLFVGNIEPRKNIVGLLKGYALMPEKVRESYSLVLVGGKGWNDGEIQTALSEAKQNNLDVIQTGYVSDDQRAALYQRASLFVLPSHYEGFGMPVLEAAAYNVPVAVSDIPVLHEVAGDAAVYFNQNDPSDIAKKIEKVLTDSILRDGLIAKSKTNLERFSWDKTAAIVYKAIESSLRL